MRKTIKKHLQENFPIIFQQAYSATYNLRFELGGEVLKNGTQERVNQAVHRVTSIYEKAIGYDPIVLVIKEYEDSFWDTHQRDKFYLSTLVPLAELVPYKGPFAPTSYTTDVSGNLIEDKIEGSVFIGQVQLQQKTIHQLMLGIANLEMGFKPAIPQDLTFYNLTTGIGLRMYDDRGCDVWSGDKEQLRPLYEQFKEWILDYNRPEIDAYFK